MQNKKLFVIFGIFFAMTLAGCQNILSPQNYATEISSGSWTDIVDNSETIKSDNTNNIYIDGYEQVDQEETYDNVYYGQKPIYISNISGLDLHGSEGLNLVISGNSANIKPTKAGVLTITSNTDIYLDYGKDTVNSGKNFTLNFYPSKLFGSFSFYPSKKTDTFGYQYIDDNPSNLVSFSQSIAPKVNLELWANSKNSEDLASGDIKFFGLIQKNQGTGGVKLSDFIKLQNINITDISGQNTLKNIYISADAKILDYSYSGSSVYANLSNLQTGNTIIIIDRFDNVYLIGLNFSKLNAGLTKDEEEDYQYNISIDANYPLSSKDIRSQLDKILGSGAYDISFSSNYIYITYRPIPGKTYSGSLIITDIFGQTGVVKINIYHKELKIQFINSQIAGNTFNVLPTKGSYNQFFVNYQNLTSRKYKISTCDINFKGLSTFSGTDFSRGYNMENYLFDCSGGTVITGTYTHSGTFAYRKTYSAKIPITNSISSGNYYKLEILSDGQDTNKNYNNTQKVAYFARTNIGITSKSASGYIYIWPVYLDSGKFVTSGSLYMYDANTTGKNQKYSLGKIPMIIANPGIQPTPKIISIFDDQNNKSLVVVGSNAYSNYYNGLSIESYIDGRSLLDNKYKGGGYSADSKIYGYTDRGLYKPNDDIYFNGFVRNNNNTNIPKGEVTITIMDPQDGNIIYTSSGLKLDSFGGFKGSYHIPTSIKLSDYFVQYQYGDTTNSANIKILEYQKPTYSADINYKTDNDNFIISILPKYYFGQNLTDYNIKTSVNIQAQTNNYRRNEDKYYYNIDPDIYIGDNTKKYSDINKSGEYFINYSSSGNINTPVESNIYINTKIFDNKSNEVQTFEKYIDIKPDIMIGLVGQYQDWTDTGNFTMEGVLSGRSEYLSDIDKKYNLTYDIYYKNWEQDNYNGVDGSIYYSVNGQYQTIKTGAKLDTKDDNFSFDVKMPAAGDYLIKIYIKDNNGKIVSVNSKDVYFYDWSNEEAMMGLMPNNYQMQLKVDDKTYKFGDKVKLNLMPYIKGGKAIITVEKNNQILDNFTYDLDGEDIYIPIRKGYEPNVNIYVNQIAGSDLDLGIRKEARFFAGMTNIDVDPSSNKLNIDIKTDKQEYKPGELVKMKIKTTNSDGNLVESRLSVAVVDKSLNDIYSYIKEPLEYFYRKSVSIVGNYTNLKLLYLSLKAFIGDGSKGGGGAGPTSFGAVRNDLADLAFWRSDIYTTGGIAEFTFRLPDNLTTRDTEVIGITKDTKLGVANSEFLTTKDLIVEPNLPLFLTIGDKLIIPTKIILNPRNNIVSGEMVKLSAKLIIPGSNDIILGNINLPVNKTALLPISIPYDLYDISQAKIYISAEYNGLSDTVVNTIPIRKDGFSLTNIYNQPLSKNGSININNDALKGKVEASVSGLPIFDLNNIIKYLLHYPYGCTEQLASGLFPILYAHLSNPKLIDKSILNGDNIYINNSGNNIYNLTTDTITKILKNQNTDGGFGYRGTDNSNYDLSAYIYNLLSVINKNHFAKNIDLGINIAKVEKYLQNTKTEPSGYMYYIYYKTMNANKISTDTIISLQNMIKGTGSALSAKVLLNYISVTNNGKILYPITTNDLDKYSLDKGYTYNNFLDKYILASIYLRTLIVNKSSSQDIYNIYNYIMNGKGLDYNNLWGRSTQTNMNVLLAVNDYVNYILQSSKKINCQLTIGTGTYNFSLDQNNLEKKYSLTYEKSVNTAVSWNCDSEILMNISDNFVNINPQSTNAKNTGIKSFYLDFDNNKKVGSIVDFTGGFILTENAHQLAVEYFIPSDTKLLYNIQTKNKDQDNDYYDNDLPFTYGDNYRCRPTHREVQFDKLFLYYDVLPKDISCKFTIKGIKAFDGKSNLQPSKIWEMYENNINASFIR